MATVEYIYERSDEPITDEWFERLRSVDTKTEYDGGMYWLTYRGGASKGTALIEVSACGTKYRYAWRERGEDREFDVDHGEDPSPRWFNPDGLIQQGVEPLPFSWRT